MDLLEHQGKELFERHGIKLIPRAVAASAAEARGAAGRLGPVAVKVQVQAGGRGKGGGIVLAKTPEEAGRAARKMFEDGFPEDARDGAGALLERIYEVLITNDATLVEVNPLAVLKDGRVVPLDAKVTIDDNALYRHPDLAEYASAFPLEPTEARARELGLQYVKLDGQVGIIGNGAGLVMSTLDVVQQAGGAAANFLDVGGGAGADVMAASLEVILSDPAVRSVLVNIFGGITRGDLVARGILEALERVEATVPIVVRLDGTNAEEGRGLRADAGPPRIVPPAPMLEAARLAVEAAA